MLDNRRRAVVEARQHAHPLRAPIHGDGPRVQELRRVATEGYVLLVGLVEGREARFARVGELHPLMTKLEGAR